MYNPNQGNPNTSSGVPGYRDLRYYLPTRTRQSGFTATHEVQSFSDPNSFQEEENLAPFLWSMIEGTDLGPQQPQISGFVQNIAVEQSAWLQNHTGHGFGPQHVGTSSYPTSSNPAPTGEGILGTSHQTTFPNTTVSYPLMEQSTVTPLQLSQVYHPPTGPGTLQTCQNSDVYPERQPTHEVYGFFFDRSKSLPKTYYGMGHVPECERYKPYGYLYADGLGLFPYYVRSERDLQQNHAVVGYLQKAGTPLDRRNKIYYHFENTQELEVFDPKTANLFAILQKQGSIDIGLMMEQQMGSEVYSPTFVLIYQNGAPFVLEHGRTMAFEHLRWKILAAPRDPIRDIQNFSMPSVDNEQGGNEDDDLGGEVKDNIYITGTSRILKHLLQKHTPQFNKLLDQTILFFHVKLLKGEYFDPAVHDRNLSPGRKQLEDRVCCHSAWAEALAFSPTGEYEESYHDQNSSTPAVRIIVEDHFFYILSNRKKAAASYVKLVQKQVELLVSEIGVDAFLHLFSYEINEEHFNDHKWRATATLCNDQNIPFHQPRFVDCLKTLFYGPVPPTLTTWPPQAKSVGFVHFRGILTVDVIGVLAAHWLFTGIRLSKGFTLAGMRTDIGYLVSVMRSRLLLTPPHYIVSLQAIIDNPESP